MSESEKEDSARPAEVVQAAEKAEENRAPAVNGPGFTINAFYLAPSPQAAVDVAPVTEASSESIEVDVPPSAAAPAEQPNSEAAESELPSEMADAGR